MTKPTNLDTAVEAVRKLPEEAQETIAHELMETVRVYRHLRLSEEQREEVRRRLAEPDPEMASDKEVEAVFNRYIQK